MALSADRSRFRQNRLVITAYVSLYVPYVPMWLAKKQQSQPARPPLFRAYTGSMFITRIQNHNRPKLALLSRYILLAVNPVFAGRIRLICASFV